ncbi:MAG TPA: SMP-30/gluconolactonase/LRE family protein [Sphingomicrobium sp.]|nr:SMP-30/gluconolactonase/LRE family protein [Sphingomicrobium sp.]
MSGVRIIEDSGRSLLGEGPLWSPRDKAIYWVDILGRRLRRYSLDGESIDRWDMPEPIGWVIERRHKPGFVAGFASGFAELTLDPLTITPIGNPEPHLPGNRMNDAKADPQGRIWAGTMAANCKGESGSLYRLDPDFRWARVDGPYGIANGPAISADGRTLLHTDTARREIYRFTVLDDGSLSDRQLFIRFEADWGFPDGMTLDADGGLWVAHWGGGRVSRFSPEGRLNRAIELPASQITSCTFAGPELDRMFVTSAADGVGEPDAGKLFEVDPGCRGLPTLAFDG